MLKCGRNEGGLTDQILSYKFPSSASTDTSLSWSKDAPIPVECARGIPDVAQPRWFSDLSNPFSLVTPDRGSVVFVNVRRHYCQEDLGRDVSGDRGRRL